MIFFESFVKAIGWLIIGTLAGLASIGLILASSAIFSIKFSGNIITGDIIMFLCVGLMSGAGADYLFCSHFHKGYRIASLFLLIIAVLIIYFSTATIYNTSRTYL